MLLMNKLLLGQFLSRRSLLVVKMVDAPVAYDYLRFVSEEQQEALVK